MHITADLKTGEGVKYLSLPVAKVEVATMDGTEGVCMVITSHV